MRSVFLDGPMPAIGQSSHGSFPTPHWSSRQSFASFPASTSRCHPDRQPEPSGSDRSPTWRGLNGNRRQHQSSSVARPRNQLPYRRKTVYGRNPNRWKCAIFLAVFSEAVGLIIRTRLAQNERKPNGRINALMCKFHLLFSTRTTRQSYRKTNWK